MNASSSVSAPSLDRDGAPLASTLPPLIADEPVEPFRLFHIGGRDDHAHAGPARAHALDQLPELPARERIDPGRRLVEDEQVRIVDQAAAQPELLPHPARKLLGRAVGERREAGAGEQFGDLSIARLFRMAEQAPEELDVLAHAEVGIEVLSQALRHVGDARTDVGAVVGVAHVAAEHVDRARLDLARAGDQAEQRGLADAVGPDEADHAAGGDVERDRVEREHVPITLREALDARHRTCARARDCGQVTWARSPAACPARAGKRRI